MLASQTARAEAASGGSADDNKQTAPRMESFEGDTGAANPAATNAPIGDAGAAAP